MLEVCAMLETDLTAMDIVRRIVRETDKEDLKHAEVTLIEVDPNEDKIRINAPFSSSVLFVAARYKDLLPASTWWCVEPEYLTEDES